MRERLTGIRVGWKEKELVARGTWKENRGWCGKAIWRGGKFD